MMRLRLAAASAKIMMRVNSVRMKMLPLSCRIERQQYQPGGDQRHDDVAGVELKFHRLAAGNSPSGRTTSTIAINR